MWKNAAFHRALRLAMPVDLAREVGLLNGTRDMKVYAKASLRSPLLVGIVKPRLYLPVAIGRPGRLRSCAVLLRTRWHIRIIAISGC